MSGSDVSVYSRPPHAIECSRDSDCALNEVNERMQNSPGQPAAPAHSPLSPGSRISATRKVQVAPDWSGPRTDFRHTWEGIINVDQFRWMVRRDMQEQLAMAQKELGATHVRAVGMFDDEMRVYCPSPAAFMGHEAKQPRTNWQTVDYVIDSLGDLGLQPVFTTSFIPSAMASGPVTVFSTKAHTSPPKDLVAVGVLCARFGAACRRPLLHRYRSPVAFRSLERTQPARLVLGWRSSGLPPTLAGHVARDQIRRLKTAESVDPPPAAPSGWKS